MSLRWFVAIVGVALFIGGSAIGMYRPVVTDAGYSATCGSADTIGSPEAASQDHGNAYRGVRTNLYGKCREKTEMFNIVRYAMWGTGGLAVLGALVVGRSQFRSP